MPAPLETAPEAPSGRPLHIAISCGGTGGHTIPGLATAAELRARGHRVTLVLTDRATDRTTAAGWDGTVLTFPADYLSPRHPFRSLRAWLTLRASRRAAIRAFRADRPDAVLAMGSYTSYAAAAAALAEEIPLVFHESNVVPGRAVVHFAPWCAAVAAGLDALREHLRVRRTPVVATGTPIRPGLLAAAQRLREAPPPPAAVPRILVVGGSQGARTLNVAAAAAFAQLRAEGRAFSAVHLAGPAHYDEAKALYGGAPGAIGVELLPYSAEMDRLYAAADLVVARAGASTLAELAAFRLPALLVPYPLAAKDHQAANARAVAALGAADLLADADCTPARLHGYLAAFLDRPAAAARMRDAYDRSGAPDPAAAPGLLADLLLRVAARA